MKTVMPGVDKYSDEHRMFLQGIMCKGVLNDREVHRLHDRALKACNIEIPEKKSEKDQLLVENIQTINGEISKLGLSIRKGQDEDSGKSCFMLINNNNRMVSGSRDLGTQVQTQWSQLQLEYLRLLATEILQSDDKAISSREALHLTDQVGKDGGKKMSLEEAEDTVNKLIQSRWVKTLDGNRQLTLDVRFIGEMEGWMLEVMGRDTIAHCKSCRKLVIRGLYCQHCDNNIAWHHYCVEKMVSRGVDVKCPECKTKVAEGRKSSSRSEGEQSQGRVESSKSSRHGDKRQDKTNDNDDGRGEPTKSRRIKRRMSADDSEDSD